uniref:Uncharacterized protein n=1 Tax=Otarine gammaherpesvirus 4 TaxID=2801541 RepID=A0A8B6T2V0_9GAMA|nr:hypothetical protein [Otarine gammaherpesvirus 4]
MEKRNIKRCNVRKHSEWGQICQCNIQLTGHAECTLECIPHNHTQGEIYNSMQTMSTLTIADNTGVNLSTKRRKLTSR